jgi:hypothetical protein
MNVSGESKATTRSIRRRWAPGRFVRARPWLAVSTAVFIAVFVTLLLSRVKPASALLLSFDAGVLLYLAMLTRMFNLATAEPMCRHALGQDAGRRSTLWIAVALSTCSLLPSA